MADDTTTTNTEAQPPVDDFDVSLTEPESGPLGTDVVAAEVEPPKSDLPNDLVEIMRREKLPSIEGETPEAANLRLSTHLYKKNIALNVQNRELREADRRRAAEAASLRQSLDPIIREHYRRERQAQLEEQAAQIPDRETDPEGYRVWLQEETLRRLDAYERGAEEQALTAEEQEAERQVQEQLAAIDGVGYQKVAEGLGLARGSTPDPEFSTAYDLFSESAVDAARKYWPEASDEQIQRFVSVSQKLDVRRAEMNGVDIRDVMKGRMNLIIDGLVRRGLVTRTAAKAAIAEAAAGTTNGQGQQPKTGTGAAQPPRTVAQTVRADAAATARRGPNAVAATTRAGSLSGQLPDASDLDEDAYVEAALANMLGDENQRTVKHRKER